MPGTEIRAYEPDLRQDVLRFVDVSFPNTVKADPAYFDWKFGRNPLGSSLASGRGYFVALDGGEIVGQVATMADRIELGGASIPCVWVVDLVVAPDHRGRGLVAPRLIKAVMDAHDVALANGMGEKSVRLFEAMHWRLVPGAELSTSLLVVHPSRALGTGRGGPWAALSLLDRPVARLQRRQRAEGVEPLESVDGIDALVGAVGAAMGPTTHRSAQTYRWRFRERPSGTATMLGVPGGAGGVGGLRGVAVTRLFEKDGRRWSEMADVVVDPADRECVALLTAAVAAHAVDAGCDLVRAGVSSSALSTRLRPPRWLRRPAEVGGRVYVRSRDNTLANRITSAQWWMTGLISDRVDTGQFEWSGAA